MWQDAWRIAKYEFRISWRGYLITLLLLAYTSFFSSVMLYGHLVNDEEFRMEWNIDLGYFCMLPLFGFLMNQTMFRYWKEDTYSRKLAEWHTMPIGVSQIIAGRMLLLILVLLVNWILFFGIQYAVLEELRARLDPAEFVIYASIWLGYSLFAAAVVVYMELGFPGRVYFFLCFVYVFVIGLVTLTLALSGRSAIVMSLAAAADRSWETAALSLAAAAAGVAGLVALLHRRIRRRSLWT